MNNSDMYEFVRDMDANNAINEIAIGLDLIRNAYRRCTDLNIHQIEKIENLAFSHGPEIKKLALALDSAKAQAHAEYAGARKYTEE